MKIIDKAKKALGITKPYDTEEEQKDRKKIDQLKNYKKRFEPRWYVANAFFEGVHFTFGKKDHDGNWERVPTPKNKTIREIPKAKKQILNMRNMLLKIKQKPVVYPDRNVLMLDAKDSTNAEKIAQEEDAAIKQGRYIEYYLNEKLKLRRYLPKLIRYAQQYNVAYIQILNENGKKSVAVYDPFDVSIYPKITSINDHPCLVKHTSKSWDDLLGNDDYDQEALKRLDAGVKEGKFSDSVYKQAMESDKYGIAPDDTCIVDEMYQMVKVKQDADGKNIEDFDSFEGQYDEVERCLIKTYIGSVCIRKEQTNLSYIPLSMFIWGDEPYQTSVLEDMIPMNRAYDVFVSKLEHKAKKLDTGRLSIQKGEDAKIITTNDGEIIRWKRHKPETMDEAGVPNAFIMAKDTVEDDIREQGVSAATGGALPSGVEAYRAIETLKESDYASIGTQQDNLTDCLTDLTEKLVDMLAYDMTDSEVATMKNRAGKMEAYKVIGKRGADNMMSGQGEPAEGEEEKKSSLPQGMIVIDPNRNTKVEVESEMTHTQEAKKELLLDLYREQLIPAELVIEMLKVGNAQEIMDKLMLEQTKGKSMIDMPDFQLLPEDLQAAIAKFMAEGATISNGPDGTGGPINGGGAAPVVPAVAPQPGQPGAPAPAPAVQ